MELFIGLVNLVSIVSLLLIMVGASLLVLQGGLFDAFLHSYRRFLERTDKRTEYAAQFRGGSNSKQGFGKFRLTYPLLLSGALLFVASYLCSIWIGK